MYKHGVNMYNCHPNTKYQYLGCQEQKKLFVINGFNRQAHHLIQEVAVNQHFDKDFQERLAKLIQLLFYKVLQTNPLQIFLILR